MEFESQTTTFSLIAWGKFGSPDSWGFLTDLLQRLRFLATSASADERIQNIEFTNLDLDALDLTNELANTWAKCAASSRTFRRITWTDCEGGGGGGESSSSSSSSSSMDSLLVPLEWNSVQEMVCCRVPLLLDQQTRLNWKNRRFQNCTRLQYLRLEVCKVGPSALQTLTSTPNLQSLHLRRCQLEPDCIPVLVEFLQSNNNSKTLQCFNVHWSGLEDDQLAVLSRALLYHPSLKEWDLAGNKCREHGMEAVSRLVMQSNTLETLCLREQCCCVEDEKLDISSLVTALSLLSGVTPHPPAQSSCSACYNSLVRLDLGVNKLDDDDMIQLAGALSNNNKTLKELDVRSNRITNRGVEIFAQSLVTMGGLRKLWLQDNPSIDEEGAVAMRDALKVNVHLEYVGFSQDFTCWYELEYYTALNWGGRRLLQEINTTNIALWPLVLERASKYDGGTDRVANILYYLLRGGPALLYR
jgi:hypothetical protein